MRGGWWGAMDPDQDDIPTTLPSERSMLRRQVDALELELRRVRARLGELDDRPQPVSGEQGGRT